jgi:hypothetical protein
MFHLKILREEVRENPPREENWKKVVPFQGGLQPTLIDRGRGR